MRRDSTCIAKSLNAQVGPWKSSRRKRSRPICVKRRGIWMAPSGIGAGDESEKLVMSRIAAHIGRHNESRGGRVMAGSKCWQGRQGRAKLPAYRGRHRVRARPAEPLRNRQARLFRASRHTSFQIHFSSSRARHGILQYEGAREDPGYGAGSVPGCWHRAIGEASRRRRYHIANFRTKWPNRCTLRRV